MRITTSSNKAARDRQTLCANRVHGICNGRLHGNEQYSGMRESSRAYVIKIQPSFAIGDSVSNEWRKCHGVVYQQTHRNSIRSSNKCVVAAFFANAQMMDPNFRAATDECAISFILLSTSYAVLISVGKWEWIRCQVSDFAITDILVSRSLRQQFVI